MGVNEKAIIKTLIYSDIFSFPLTENELYYYLHTPKKVPQKEFKKALKSLHAVTLRHGYFALKGKSNIINKRINELSEYEKKISLAKKSADLLSLIPTVLFIGISGSLGAGSGKRDDDIDYIIICKKGTMFITRFLCVFLTLITGRKRNRKEEHAPNAICLNMFLSEDGLKFKKENQDIYTAREIAQINPLFERDNMYWRLLHENNWILNHLANVSSGKNVTFKKKESKKEFIFTLLNPIFALFQMFLINKHKTTEYITSKQLFFHPSDSRGKILSKYRKRMMQSNLL